MQPVTRLSLSSKLLMPKSSRGMWGYQVGQVDQWGNWLPLVICAGKFTTADEAGAAAMTQVRQADKALKRRAKLYAMDAQRSTGGGPSAA